MAAIGPRDCNRFYSGTRTNHFKRTHFCYQKHAFSTVNNIVGIEEIPMTLKQSWNLDGLAIFQPLEYEIDLRFVLRLHIHTCGKNKMDICTAHSMCRVAQNKTL